MIKRDFIETSALATLSGSMLEKLACSKPVFDELIHYDELELVELVKSGKVTEVEIKI